MAAMGTRTRSPRQSGAASQHDGNGDAAGVVRREKSSGRRGLRKKISGIAPFYLTHTGSGRSCRLETRVFPGGTRSEDRFVLNYSQGTRNRMKLYTKILLRFKPGVALSLVVLSATGPGISKTQAQTPGVNQTPDAQQIITSTSNAPTAQLAGQTIVDGELLVQFKDGETDAEVNDAMTKG